MRQTPVNDYLEEISTELPEELYGNLSDAVYETVCDFDEEVAQLKAENAKLRKMVEDLHALAESVLPERKSDYITICSVESCIDYYSRTMPAIERRMRELGVEVDG